MKKHKNNLVSIVLFTFFILNNGVAFSQCHINATINPNVICAGSPVTLNSSGGCGFLMNNYFNNGTLGAGWSSAVGVSFTNPCGPGPNGIHLWMGNNVPIPRTLTTVPFNVMGICQITFWLRFTIQGQSSPCEGSDLVDEGVSLQFTTNGGATYTDIVYFRPDGVLCPSFPWATGFVNVTAGQQTPFTTWQQYTFSVPAAAQSPNTQFRWRQHSYSGQGFDHWGVDEIQIVCPSGVNVAWSHGATGFNPPVVYPTTDSCFVVTINDTFYPGSDVHDTVCVTVMPVSSNNFNVVSPICTDGQTTITYTGNAGPTAVFNWNFSGGTVISGAGAGPYVVQWSVPGQKFIGLEVLENGCSSGIRFDSVMVYQTPIAIFTSTPQSGCSPLTVNFTDQSIPSGTSYLWSFGDSNTSTLKDPVNLYNNSGLYNVQLIVTGEGGCSDTLTRPNFISVSAAPVVNITAVPQQVCAGDTSKLTASSPTSGVTWLWGDGQTSSEIFVTSNSTTTYSVTGTEPVNSCTTTTEIIVTVLDAPAVEFDATPLKGCVPHTVNFTSTSTNSTSWNWNFGNGATSNLENPVHTFNNVGTYDITLIATSAFGCKDTLTKNDFIEGWPQPYAEFTVVPEFGKIYQPNLTFFSESIAPFWLWNFGDGNTSSSSPPVIHTFPALEGEYEVTLVVSNEFGCTDSITKTVIILDDVLVFPNIITPNGDGINDVLEITNAEKFPNNTLQIFNRWGKKVFEQMNYQNNWGGEGLIDGTYYYVFKYLDKVHHSSLKIIRVQ